MGLGGTIGPHWASLSCFRSERSKYRKGIVYPVSTYNKPLRLNHIDQN